MSTQNNAIHIKIQTYALWSRRKKIANWAYHIEYQSNSEFISRPPVVGNPQSSVSSSPFHEELIAIKNALESNLDLLQENAVISIYSSCLHTQQVLSNEEEHIEDNDIDVVRRITIILVKFNFQCYWTPKDNIVKQQMREQILESFDDFHGV